jgi:hypothetical protein
MHNLDLLRLCIVCRGNYQLKFKNYAIRQKGKLKVATILKKNILKLGLILVFLISSAPAGKIVHSQGNDPPPPEPLSPEANTVLYFPLLRHPGYVPPSYNSHYIINHNSVELFDRIPERYLTAARSLRMLFSDASVGDNINDSLDCLGAPTWADSSPDCRRAYYDSNWHWRLFTQSDLDQGLVPAPILFVPNPTRYNRGNWTYQFRQGSWNDLTRDFIYNLAPAYINTKDVLSYQFSYLVVDAGDNIADPNIGFFGNSPLYHDIHDLEAYWARNPSKVFFLWTSSLARSIGTQSSTDFNNLMRQYAIDHRRFLLDVADIESHTDKGVPCFDHRDGIPYCDQNTGNCENYPNDGKNYPAICQEYTTEYNAGHLGSVSAGRLRIAKAFWVLMAKIAGWNGVSP